MTCAVAIVRTFGAQHETVQAPRRAYGVKSFPAPRERHLVHVGLVAHVKEQHIVWRTEYIVQRDGQFHHTQVRAQNGRRLFERTVISRSHMFRGQLFEFRKGKASFTCSWRINTFEYAWP